MIDRSRGVFLRHFAVLLGRGCVRLRFFVLAKIVIMGRLMVMMRGGMVVSGSLEVMLTRRMLR